MPAPWWSKTMRILRTLPGAAAVGGVLLLVSCRDTTAPSPPPTGPIRDGETALAMTQVVGFYRLVAIDTSPMPAVLISHDTVSQWVAANLLITSTGWAVALGVSIYTPSMPNGTFYGPTFNGYYRIQDGALHLTGYSDTVTVTRFAGHTFLSARVDGRSFLYLHQERLE